MLRVSVQKNDHQQKHRFVGKLRASRDKIFFESLQKELKTSKYSGKKR